MKKKSTVIELIVAAVIFVAGIVSMILGFINNTDGSVTKDDVWLLAGFVAVVVGIVLLVNAIAQLTTDKPETVYSKSEQTKRLAYAAMFAALSYIGFQFFRIDIPVGTEKTAFHLGNTFVVLAALFLGGTWGGMAGAVGLTIADLTSGYVTSAPKTFLLKLLIGLITGFVAHKIFHISKPKPAKKVFKESLIASVCGLVFNVIADPLVGYLYKKYLFGLPQDIATALTKISSVTTGVNAVLSIICAVVIYAALRPALSKSGLFFRLENDSKEEKKA